MAKNGKPPIGFIGQGWIGKAYADNFEHRGYEVVRYALEKPYAQNKDRIKECDIVFIAVWTPTTPRGFDTSVIESVLPLVGKGKTAVIKSTVLPGTTARLQQQFPDIVLLVNPEFLSIATSVHDAAHPFVNLVGMPVHDTKHYMAAEKVIKCIPKAKYSTICMSQEAEIFKYTHNASGYAQVILFNLMYDLAQAFGASWEVVNRAIQADPLISNRYSNPIHKSGRGAGGGCFIKDIAALRMHFEEHLPHDTFAIDVFAAMESKNMHLLTSTDKDLDLLEGVYGQKAVAEHRKKHKKQAAKKPAKKPAAKKRR